MTDSSDNWTDTWAEVQTSPLPFLVELWTLELLHPSFKDALGNTTSIRAVNDVRDHDLLLEASAPLNPSQTATFTAIPFDTPWFETEEGKVPELRIRIDNIGREVASYLAEAVKVNAAIQVIFRCHLWNSADGSTSPAMDPVTFDLRQVTVNENYVEGTASPADLANLQFLRVIYDIENYAALSQ